MVKKARQKPVKSPSKSPLPQVQQPSNQPTPENVALTPSTPSVSGDNGANYAAQDAALDALVTGTQGSTQATPLPLMEMDIAVYERMVKPVCYVTSSILDWTNRRFLKKSFRPMSEDQIDLVRADLAVALKKTFDAMLPELAKKNPEWVMLGIMFIGIYTANTEDLPVEKEAKKVIPAVPSVSSVEVQG